MLLNKVSYSLGIRSCKEILVSQSLRRPLILLGAAAIARAMVSSSTTTTLKKQNDDDPKPISMEQDSAALSLSHLSRPELLKRRYNNLKLLSNCYRDLYWALLEDLKSHYRDYLWEFGVTPYKEAKDVSESNKKNETELDQIESPRCAFVGCKLKVMALTTFCHLHILSDSNQKLYKPCNYVIKSAQAGPITCGKPILRSSVPSLCTAHFQKAQKHLSSTLKKTGLNASSTRKMAPKLHIIVAEYIRHIQVKRNEQRRNKSEIVVKQENDI